MLVGRKSQNARAPDERHMMSLLRSSVSIYAYGSTNIRLLTEPRRSTFPWLLQTRARREAIGTGSREAATLW